MAVDILVIGCGVAGLSCARLLQEQGHRVRIWAAAQSPRTTSDVAAAFWYPYRVYPEERVAGWARDSFAAFARIQDGDAGVLTRSAIELLHGPAETSWSATLPGARAARPEELPDGFAYGQVFDSYVIETPRYLPWLRRAFLGAGGTIEVRRLATLREALGHAEVIVHCSGLGARELADDRRMQPVRGQLVRLKNPGLDRVIIDEQSGGSITYVVPRSDDVILGGTSEEGEEQLAPSGAATEAILARCLALEPRLRSAPILGTQVGLRPCRAEVRVEREEIEGTPVIHNYGHGGAGITLSWGCAIEALSLLRA